MEANEQVMTWLVWHQAVKYIQQDIPRVESMDLRFPSLATWVLRLLGSQVYKMEQETAKVLKANGIRIVKEKVDQGELFVVWSHRGSTDIFRIHEGKLRSEVQNKINELMVNRIAGSKT